MKFLGCIFVFAVIMAAFVQLAPANPFLEGIVPAESETAKRQCALVGEYCAEHSGCCSKSCLGFRRRCVTNFSLQLAGSEVDSTIG